MRFYKPRLREYVSTQVDMPWEFLQGVAEQKQKGFDSALGLASAGNKLLDFDVIPGDIPGKQKVQQEYNDKFYKITDYLRQTGDFNTASRYFTDVIRDITQDKRVINMKNAPSIYSEELKKVKELDTKGELTPWNRRWDAMFKTYDPESNESKPYFQELPYEANTIGKNLKAEYKEAIDNKVIQTFGDKVSFDNTTGEWKYKKTGTRLGKELIPIMEAAEREILPRYATYVKDRMDYEIQTGQSDHGQNWLRNMKNALAAEFHVDNVEFDYKTDAMWLKRWEKEFENMPSEWVPLEALDIFNPNQNTNQFIPSEKFGTGYMPMPSKEQLEKNPKLKEEYDAFMKANQINTPYSALTPENKKIALKYFDSKIFDNPDFKALKSKYVNGNASQDELRIINSQISNFRNQFFKTAKQNVQARQIGNLKKITFNYVGIPNAEGQFDASNLKEGAGFLTVNTPIYDVKTMDKITLKDLDLAPGDKAEIVKEFSYKSPFYLLSGEKPEWSVPRQLVIKDKSGNLKGIYAIPRVASDKDEDKIYAAFAKNSMAIYTPTIPVQSSRSNYKIKFTPVDGSLRPLSQQEINAAQQAGIQLQGSYDIFDQNGNLINNVILQTPEQATEFLNNLD